jgi:hypothetical protein
MSRRSIFRDILLFSRRIRYPFPQGTVGAWWFKKRKPTKVAQQTYRHRRTRSARFIPTVAPPVSIYTPFRRRRHSNAPTAAVPNYRHRRSHAAYFIPNVAPSGVIQDVLLAGVNVGRLMTHN